MYKIKPLFILIILLLLSTGLIKAQSTDSLIKDIRAKYQSIRSNLKNYDTTSREEWEESTEGGQIIGYYKKKDLKLIEGFYFGETGKTETEYYFDKGLLLFVFEKRYAYNRPIYWDKKHAQENSDSVTFDSVKTIIAEDKLYFYREKLIRWISNKTTEVDISLLANSLYGQSLIDHAYKLQDIFKK